MREVGHTYNSSYSGDGDWEDLGLKAAKAKSSQDPISTNKKLSVLACFMGSINRKTAIQADPARNSRPYPKITMSKMDWGHGSSSRVPKFKPQYRKKKERKEI
jgi:hypothetical protein